MRSVPLAAAKARFSEVIDSLSEPIVITRRGQPVAVLLAVPTDPDDVDSLLIANDPGFRAMVRKALWTERRSAKDGRKGGAAGARKGKR